VDAGYFGEDDPIGGCAAPDSVWLEGDRVWCSGEDYLISRFLLIPGYVTLVLIMSMRYWKSPYENQSARIKSVNII
jgi:hypothetical protein